MSVSVLHGDMLAIMPTLEAESFDSCVCDPPYHLTSIVKRFGGANAAPAQHGTDGAFARASRGFMGKQWDGGDIAFRPETWAEVWRVLKPGAHLVAFSSTSTYHHMACAIEDAGFEIRDQLAWVYGSGFPKSHDISKAIDKAAGTEREVVGVAGRSAVGGGNIVTTGMAGGEYYTSIPATEDARKWQGWGTAFKPAWEPIVFARKPLSERTIAANVLKHGTGGLNIDACRIESGGEHMRGAVSGTANGMVIIRGKKDFVSTDHPGGRWPANLCHDGSDEVLSAFAAFGESKAGSSIKGTERSRPCSNVLGERGRLPWQSYSDSGSPARFFFSAKADAGDRLGSKHPTVKPVDLMRWLVRMVTPPGGRALDPFAGSGTTGMACVAEGFDCTLIEREAEYVADIKRRLGHVRGDDTPLFSQKGLF